MSVDPYLGYSVTNKQIGIVFLTENSCRRYIAGRSTLVQNGYSLQDEKAKFPKLFQEEQGIYCLFVSFQSIMNMESRPVLKLHLHCVFALTPSSVSTGESYGRFAIRNGNSPFIDFGICVTDFGELTNVQDVLFNKDVSCCDLYLSPLVINNLW